MNQKTQARKNFETLINQAFNVNPPENPGPQSRRQQTEEQISEEFMRNALGGPITK